MHPVVAAECHLEAARRVALDHAAEESEGAQDADQLAVHDRRASGLARVEQLQDGKLALAQSRLHPLGCTARDLSYLQGRSGRGLHSWGRRDTQGRDLLRTTTTTCYEQHPRQTTDPDSEAVAPGAVCSPG